MDPGGTPLPRDRDPNSAKYRGFSARAYTVCLGIVLEDTRSMNRNDLLAAAGWLGFLAALIAAGGNV